MNPYLIEPYTIFQGKKKDKHWMEIADEEALYFKMIQEQKLQQDLQQQQQQNAVIGGNPYDAYRAAQPVVPTVSEIFMSWEPANALVYWQDGTFSGETNSTTFQSTVDWDNLTVIQVPNSNRNITSFTVGNQTPSLTSLELRNTLITSLEINNLPSLTYLSCFNVFTPSQTSLTLNNVPLLNEIECYATLITSLDFSNVPSLKWLTCRNNELVSLNISNNPQLELLNCSSNYELTTIDISNNPLLNNLVCRAALTVDSVNDILINLDNFGLTNGYVDIYNFFAIPTGDGLTAKNNLLAKGWTVTTWT
jgi:hypothetical protein